MFSSDCGEDVSEDSYVAVDRSASERVLSSDPEDELSSQWEDSSDEGAPIAPEPHTECGSIWESTDFEEHDEEEAWGGACPWRSEPRDLAVWGPNPNGNALLA